MTEKDREELEIFEARKAAASADVETAKTEAVVASARRSSDGIRTIVEKNGYVEAFRSLFQGAA